MISALSKSVVEVMAVASVAGGRGDGRRRPQVVSWGNDGDEMAGWTFKTGGSLDQRGEDRQ